MGKVASNYFNSDLNEYIGKNLPRTFTLIDVDGLQYKRSKNIIRLYEYKHMNERIGQQQLILLKKLAEIFRLVDDLIYFHIGMCRVEVVIIRGDSPYDEIEISDLVNGRTFTLVGKEIIDKFLSMEIDVNEVYKKRYRNETNEAI